jgi:metallo-beta-lactamase family protein
MATLTFIGAAQTVTGSSHLLEVAGKKILMDCGLFQGRRNESWELNSNFPVDPSTIDVVVLSHAHIDHSGKIPMLIRQGFKGPIYTTSASRDLANIMLLDSAYIQKKDAEFISKKNRKKGLLPVEALYDTEDTLQALSQFVTTGYNRTIPITKEVSVTFYDAGHILGSALVVFDIDQNGEQKRLCYTGDLGRPGRPILRDPQFVGDVDYLITESTYGGRVHMQAKETLDYLEEVIVNTVARKGKIIVPAFSVGRTQELVYDLHQLREQGRLPDIPVYVDSPLSVNATQVFRLHAECMDAEIREEILMHHDPFGFEKLSYLTYLSQSKQLNEKKGPMMIISASGMCEAGRIRHHLANNIENPDNTVLITGYNAVHTLGRKIVERQKSVNIFGDPYELNAEVRVMNSLSAHADKNELLDYHGQFTASRIKKAFLVHGDHDQQKKLKASLETDLDFADVSIPAPGDKFEL